MSLCRFVYAYICGFLVNMCMLCVCVCVCVCVCALLTCEYCGGKGFLYICASIRAVVCVCFSRFVYAYICGL